MLLYHINGDVGIFTSVDLKMGKLETTIAEPEELQGMPLFDANGTLLGMLNSRKINTNLSSGMTSDLIKLYYTKLSSTPFENIKSVPFEVLKEKYFIKYEEEEHVNNIPDDKWKKCSEAENIDDYINLELIKGMYEDGIISLRYKNKTPEYIDTMQTATRYMESLKSRGYSEKEVSNSKKIYQKDKTQIIISKELNYLIVVITGV